MPNQSIPGKRPKIDPTAFIVDNATIIGDVTIGPQSSVWFGAVVRGDVHWIKIGSRTNIQDNCVLHVTKDVWPLTLEDDVTIGHGVTLHGCHIKNRVLVGIGAILLDGVVVESDSMIAAGSLVAPGTVVPSGALMMGSPAKPKRKLTRQERARLLESAQHYVAYQDMYR
ncbi:MAG TPA: gamma carbonic anhydrase family protein [Bdellovibrionota bacterium]|nr:gamma carbonic anhydrase family protein [Bdellovibrionota bacterium]